jgi:hypothetical protein
VFISSRRVLALTPRSSSRRVASPRYISFAPRSLSLLRHEVCKKGFTWTSHLSHTECGVFVWFRPYRHHKRITFGAHREGSGYSKFLCSLRLIHPTHRLYRLRLIYAPLPTVLYDKSFATFSQKRSTYQNSTSSLTSLTNNHTITIYHLLLPPSHLLLLRLHIPLRFRLLPQPFNTHLSLSHQRPR